MRRFLVMSGCLILLWIAGPHWPALAAAEGSVRSPSETASVQDYRTVRRVGMALATLGFLLGVTRLATTESPAERQRAEGMVLGMAGVFLALAGDRMIARSMAAWFGLPASSLPIFWQ